MKTNCIIIEDQPPAQRILKKYIENMETLNLKGVFSDAIQAMEFLKSEEVNLIFLDIHLPKISGMDFLKSIHHPPHIILTTAFPDYALESYEFDVVDYLLKPFSFQRFVKAVSKIPAKTNSGQKNKVAENSRKELFIKSGYEHIKITIADIIYIKSDADYTELFLPLKKHLSSEPLRYWLEILNPDQFARSINHILLTLRNGKDIGQPNIPGRREYRTHGRAYKEDFIKKFIH